MALLVDPTKLDMTSTTTATSFVASYSQIVYEAFRHGISIILVYCQKHKFILGIPGTAETIALSSSPNHVTPLRRTLGGFHLAFVVQHFVAIVYGNHTHQSFVRGLAVLVEFIYGSHGLWDFITRLAENDESESPEEDLQTGYYCYAAVTTLAAIGLAVHSLEEKRKLQRPAKRKQW